MLSRGLAGKTHIAADSHFDSKLPKAGVIGGQCEADLLEKRLGNVFKISPAHKREMITADRQVLGHG